MKTAFTTAAIACLLFAMLAIPPVAMAEEPALQGRLVSPGGTPIKDFPVTVEGNNRKWVTTTDKEGNFEIETLPPGTYQVAPANEPEQTQAIQIQETERRWYEFWKKEEPKPVIMQEMQIETGKTY